MQVFPIWQLAIPLPAVLLITVSLYMMVLGIGLWIRYCLKDYCSLECGQCCPDLPVCEQCIRLGEMCDCRLPAVGAFLPEPCSLPPCPRWDCACTCHAPECDTCNCFCFEITMK